MSHQIKLEDLADRKFGLMISIKLASSRGAVHKALVLETKFDPLASSFIVYEGKGLVYRGVCTHDAIKIYNNIG